MQSVRSVMLSCPSTQPSCFRGQAARAACALASRGSTFLAPSGGLQQRRQQQQLAVRRPLATRAAAVPLAQPLLRVAGRLVARLLGSSVLLNLARGARGSFAGRVGPILFAFLAAYSVAVTVYATRGIGAGSLASTDAQAPTAEALESPAAAVAASVLSPPPPSEGLERKLQQVKAAVASKKEEAAASKKEEARKVCKVCGGSGKVNYENHMTEYDGTLCPCCLGKGSVKSGKGDLFSCLLSFDP